MVLLLEKASRADSVVFLGKMPFIPTPVGERGGLLAMNKPIVTTEGLRTIVGSCCRNKDKLRWLSSATSICRLNCLKMPASSIISLLCICCRPPSNKISHLQLKFILITFFFIYVHIFEGGR